MRKRTFNFYYYRHNYDVTNMTQKSECTTRIIKIIRIVTIKNQIGCIHDCDRVNYATLKIELYLEFENKTIDVAEYRGKTKS